MAASILDKLRDADNSQVTIVALNIVLVFTAIASFIWMSALRWSDSAGVAVGIIFVFLSVIQIIVTVFWWRQVKKFKAEEDDDVKVVQMASMNGSGDCESSGLVKREFPSAEDVRFTQKVDESVVA